MLGNCRVDDAVPLPNERAHRVCAGAFHAGPAIRRALFEVRQLTHIRQVGDKDLGMGLVMELREQPVQVRAVLRQRHAVAKVVAAEPDRDERRLCGERLWQLPRERVVQLDAADAQIQRLRARRQPGDETRDVAFCVGIAGADAECVRRAERDIDNRRAHGRSGRGARTSGTRLAGAASRHGEKHAQQWERPPDPTSCALRPYVCLVRHPTSPRVSSRQPYPTVARRVLARLLSCAATRLAPAGPGLASTPLPADGTGPYTPVRREAEHLTRRKI